MWLPQLDRLDGWRTVAPDLPGHGERSSTSRWDYDRAVAEAVALVSTLPQPPTVVGLSLGGYVAIGMASARPDLVGGVILSGATADYRGWGGLSTRLFGAIVPIFGRLVAAKNEEQLRRVGGAEVADAMIRGGLSMRAAAAALRQMPGRDYAAMLAGYPGPVLVLNGERDQQNRAGEERTLEFVPWARVSVIPDAGHACSLSMPEVFADSVARFHEERLSSDAGSVSAT